MSSHSVKCPLQYIFNFIAPDHRAHAALSANLYGSTHFKTYVFLKYQPAEPGSIRFSSLMTKTSLILQGVLCQEFKTPGSMQSNKFYTTWLCIGNSLILSSKNFFVILDFYDLAKLLAYNYHNLQGLFIRDSMGFYLSLLII